MKKICALSILLCISVMAFGQYRDGSHKFVVKDRHISTISKSQKASGDVYYEQDFENYTAGDMTLIDNDGLTPAASVAAIGSNWNIMDGVALTTSWLINGDKTSDNWMITPLISLGTEPSLIWEAHSFDPSFPDGYEVLISTSGNSISNFTTVLFSVAAEETEWTKHLVDLTAYANQGVYLAFHHNSTDMYVLAVDNILVKHLEGFDVSLDSYELKKYLKPDEEAALTITIENMGDDVLRSAELNYQVNNNPVRTVLVDTLEVRFGKSRSIIHDDPIAFSEAGTYDLKIWLSNLNGGSDDNSDNDTIRGQFYVVSSTFEKTILLEEFTGTWCGWCPDGFLILDDLLVTHDNLIGVCLHAGDTMAIDATEEVADVFNTYFPGGSVDRYMFDGEELILSRGDWGDRVNERSDMAVPVDVDFAIIYHPDTREILVNASAQFSQEMTENFRFNCYVVESNIDDDDPSFNQSNYYSNLAGYEGHPYYSEPETMRNFVHNHVVREMLGGAWGVEGSIPETVVAGEPYTYQFTYALSENYNEEQVSLVVLVQEYDEDYTKREIHNAKERKLNESSDEISIALFTQDGTPIENGETIEVDGLSTDAEFGVRLSVQNVASTTTTIGVKKEVVENVDGTTNTFCWAETCYTNDVMVSSSNSVMGPDSINTEFRADLAPNGRVGVQKMRYTFFNADNTKDYASVNVFFNIAGEIGMELRNIDDLRIWPNPVRVNEVLTIDITASNAQYHSVRLFDNTSRILLDRTIDPASGKLEIQLSQYQISSGTYYILLNSDMGNEALPVVVVE